MLFTSYSWTLLDAILRGEPIVIPSDGLDMALHLQAPNADCSNDELIAPDYLRLHLDVSVWRPSVLGVASVLSQVDWPEATSDWGEIKGVSFWDGSNPWFRGELQTPKLIVTGGTFHIAPDDLSIGLP